MRNQFVCIDDLERRGASLNVKDVLGLISFLKEQRQCKVVLLLNDQELGASEPEFLENFEKVFDSFLRFAPTAKESSDIVIKGDDDVSQQLRNDCEKLNISNIRVIAKIERFARVLQLHLRESAPPVLKKAINSLVLFCYCQYLPKSSPPLDYVIEKHFRALMRTSTAEVPQEERKWRSILSAYGFTSAGDFDKIILKGIKYGFFDEDELKREAGVFERSDANGWNSPLSKAWGLFRESFKNNEEEIVLAMKRGILDTSDLSPANLDSTIKLIKLLGHSAEATDVLADFIRKSDKGAGYWDLANHHTGDVVDPDVICAFKQKKKELAVDPDPKEILLKIAERSGWSPDDVKFLARVSVEDYKALVMGATGDLLEDLIRGGLMFEGIGNADQDMQDVTRLIRQALDDIANTSRLNALRVQNLTGVAIQ